VDAFRVLRCAAVAALAVLGVAACGGGTRQDAAEKAATYRVAIVRSSFPARQRLARPARLVVEVRNTGTATMPNVAVTVDAFSARSDRAGLADAERPVWIIDRAPGGSTTAYTNTWALGPLQPGETRTFEWRLVAAHAGTYTIGYRVSPGLNGKARPIGNHTRGRFHVTISDKPVPARVDDNGNVVRGGSGVSASSSGQ
jgi:hypothetical protein